MNASVRATPWKPYAWFPWVEWREHVIDYGDGVVIRAYPVLRRWRKRGLSPLTADDLAALRRTIEKPFKWLDAYGPLWEPGSSAFWLAPNTADELAAWYAKYRPGEEGVKTAHGLDGEIKIRINVQYTAKRGSPYDNVINNQRTYELQQAVYIQNPLYQNMLNYANRR